MIRALLTSAMLALAFSPRGAAFVQTQIGAHTFTLPDGFELEQIAGPPLVSRPVSASLDPQGRLYVTESSGSNDKVEKQLEEKPHRLLSLEDSDGDGRFDRSTVFADRLMFPEGCLYWNGSVYVSAPPSIWKFTDTDGDGVADRREEWHQGKTLTGCANDLHGPTLGLDGRIYWCKGAFAEQSYLLPTGEQFRSRAAHIFRKRENGAEIEPVLTGGMDNPVAVAFSSGGERFLVGTFFQHPEAGRRDGIIHAIYGGVYGKDHGVIEGHFRTGELMPIMTHLGPSAPCAVIRYRSEVFDSDYRDNLFVISFNLHKLTRHRLVEDGASFRTIDEDFLISDNPDFHPTDVLEDADGSLIVLDTGGWYKICCPTSQLWKPDVLGAIYRIRRADGIVPPDPGGLAIQWASLTSAALVDLLDDPRPVVRDQAVQHLAARGTDDAVPALASALRPARTAMARRNAVWTLTRIDHANARTAVRTALEDQDPSVRSAATHSVALWRDEEALQPLLAALENSNLQLRRAAAEALGRIRRTEAVPALLAAAGRTDDRVLEHSLIYALIEINDASRTEAGLTSPRASTQRAALIALDQMKGSRLKPDVVIRLLTSDDPLLRRTAAWIVAHRDDWGSALAGHFQTRLLRPGLAAPDALELQHHLARLAADPDVQSVIARVLEHPETSRLARQAVLRAIAEAAPREVPADWPAAVSAHLDNEDSELVRYAVEAAQALTAAKTAPPDFTDALLRLSRDARRPVSLRLAALAALPSGMFNLDSALFRFLGAHLEPSEPVAIRADAASVLARARLTLDQLTALAGMIRNAGPLELVKLLPAFAQTADESIALNLLAALEDSPGFPTLHPDLLNPHLAKFSPAIQQKAQDLLATLELDTTEQKRRLDGLLVALPEGDIRRGQTVFNSPEAACSSCHTIGYLGGALGPDLTRIGQIRTPRDLLEAVVFPSASFVRSYESWMVLTRDDDIHSGILQTENSDEIVLATGPQTKVRIARSEIVEMRPGTISIMPQGLDEQLTREELADLLAFLKATRW